jgi:hypothetical protein
VRRQSVDGVAIKQRTVPGALRDFPFRDYPAEMRERVIGAFIFDGQAENQAWTGWGGYSTEL